MRHIVRRYHSRTSALSAYASFISRMNGWDVEYAESYGSRACKLREENGVTTHSTLESSDSLFQIPISNSSALIGIHCHNDSTINPKKCMGNSDDLGTICLDDRDDGHDLVPSYSVRGCVAKFRNTIMLNLLDHGVRSRAGSSPRQPLFWVFHRCSGRRLCFHGPCRSLFLTIGLSASPIAIARCPDVVGIYCNPIISIFTHPAINTTSRHHPLQQWTQSTVPKGSTVPQATIMTSLYDASNALSMLDRLLLFSVLCS